MKLYASIYIGSYEIILKVFQITQKKHLKELDCLRTPIDTAQDIYASGQLKKETVDRICNVLEDMKRTLALYRLTENYQIYAGSTFTAADNRLLAME